MKQFEFVPDFNHVVMAARNQAAPRMPLYEHLVGAKVMRETIGVAPYEHMNDPDDGVRDRAFADYWRFWRTMGYDTASYECCIGGILPGGGALGAHVDPVIKTRADFEKYPWDQLPDLYFERFGKCFESLVRTCPDGMKAVGGVGNGVFECVQDLVGYMNLCYMREDDPELYADLFKTMGGVIAKIWERFLSDYSDAYCVLRFGDDLGFNTMTLLSTDDIIEYVIPQYRKVVDLVHATGRPFLLHSCGNLFKVFDDIIEKAGIDAKHSNEDVIGHFSVWVDRYGERIGNFGGIDTNVLCTRTPEEIRGYILDCLEKVNGKGGIAFASGNSIPDYVPTEGYLAMVETIREWRGDRVIG